MNSVILIGNLARDPELRYSTGMNQTAICNFTVAVNDGYGERQQTSFIPIVVFGKQAENCERYLAKGRKVAVNGRIQVRNYTNREGNKVYVTEVVANNVEFLGGGNAEGRDRSDGFGSGYGRQQGGGYGGQQGGFGQQQGGFPQEDPFPAEQSQAAPRQDAPEDMPPGFQTLQDDDIPF